MNEPHQYPDVVPVIGFPSRLRQTRERRGLSAEALAAALGMTRSNISRYELGRQSPSIELCERLALALKVKPAWLAFGVDPRE